MRRLIKIYTVCQSVIDFGLKCLLAIMDVFKIRDRRAHFRNSGVKELITGISSEFID